MTDVGILILGGGEATRLPGKLALAAGELPLIARVYRNVTRTNALEVVVSGRSTFAREVDALLPVPLVVDRWDRRGPLGGMLTTMARMRARFVFAVAGDAPFVDAAFIANLAARYELGDEALVPVRCREGAAQYEPLAALYDRLAFIREGLPVLRAGRGALRAVIDRLRTRTVMLDDARAFANVNTPEDYAALRVELARETEHRGDSR